jgi:hypothetical protein
MPRASQVLRALDGIRTEFLELKPSESGSWLGVTTRRQDEISQRGNVTRTNSDSEARRDDKSERERDTEWPLESIARGKRPENGAAVQGLIIISRHQSSPPCTCGPGPSASVVLYSESSAQRMS